MPSLRVNGLVTQMNADPSAAAPNGQKVAKKYDIPAGILHLRLHQYLHAATAQQAMSRSEYAC